MFYNFTRIVLIVGLMGAVTGFVGCATETTSSGATQTEQDAQATADQAARDAKAAQATADEALRKANEANANVDRAFQKAQEK